MAITGEFTNLEIDLREPDRMTDLFEDAEFFVSEVTLQIFDYKQGDVGIERKDVNDFIGSFKTRDPKKTSIWDQLNRISEFEGYAYLIIVGHYEDSDYMSQRKCSKKEFNGALNSIATRYYGRIQIRQVDYGIQEDEEFVEAVTKILHSHRHGKASQQRGLKVSPTTKYTMPAKILALVDGIDTVAQEIADHHDLETIHDVVGLDRKMLMEVDGIGKKKAEKIVNDLGI